MVASVPELTNRTLSIEGTARQTISANSTSRGDGAPKLVPSPAVRRIAATTCEWACPRIIGPQEPTKSMNSLPSTSVMRHPSALRTNSGSQPTERQARTGELTPPGMRVLAWANRRADWSVFISLSESGRTVRCAGCGSFGNRVAQSLLR